MWLCVVATIYRRGEKREIEGKGMRMTVEQSQKFVTKLYVFFLHMVRIGLIVNCVIPVSLVLAKIGKTLCLSVIEDILSQIMTGEKD